MLKIENGYENENWIIEMEIILTKPYFTITLLTLRYAYKATIKLMIYDTWKVLNNLNTLL